MVQFLLIRAHRAVVCSTILASLLTGTLFLRPALAAPDKKKEPPKIEIPDLLPPDYISAVRAERRQKMREAVDGALTAFEKTVQRQLEENLNVYENVSLQGLLGVDRGD